MPNNGQFAPLQHIISKAKNARFGGDCYVYCMLASGFVDAVIETYLQPHDNQALIPIVEGAGGVLTTWDGSSAQYGGTVIACADQRLHTELIALLGP